MHLFSGKNYGNKRGRKKRAKVFNSYENAYTLLSYEEFEEIEDITVGYVNKTKDK